MIVIKITIRLVRESGQHDSMLMKVRIYRGLPDDILLQKWVKGLYRRCPLILFVQTLALYKSFTYLLTIEGCYQMLIRQRECHSYYRDVHYYVIICPAHCLLIGYDASRHDEKRNMFIFHRSRIEVKSQL